MKLEKQIENTEKLWKEFTIDPKIYITGEKNENNDNNNDKKTNIAKNYQIKSNQIFLKKIQQINYNLIHLNYF